MTDTVKLPRSRKTPITGNRTAGTSDFSIATSHPHRDASRSQASRAEGAVDDLSTEMTSSTQCDAATAQATAKICMHHAGYLLKFKGALLLPKT